MFKSTIWKFWFPLIAPLVITVGILSVTFLLSPKSNQKHRTEVEIEFRNCRVVREIKDTFTLECKKKQTDNGVAFIVFLLCLYPLWAATFLNNS